MRAHLQRTAFTEAEYLAMEAASAEKHEFIDGAIYDMAGGDDQHALVSVNVTSTLRAGLRGGPCRVYSSDLRVWSAAVKAYLHPDATVVCGPVERSDRKGDHLSVRNPVVVVEVVSPGSEDYDRNDKVAIYQAIPSVRDYLVVDSETRTVEHHVRGADGAWQRTVIADGEVTLAGVPVRLPLTEVFADLGS